AGGNILDVPAFDWLAAADLSGYTEEMQLHDPMGRAPELNLGAERPLALILYPPFWETRQGAPTATFNTNWTNSMSQMRETSVHANFGMGVHGHVGGGGGIGVADLNVSVSTDMQVSVNTAFSQFNTTDQQISESFQRGVDATNLKPLVVS